jgi:4-hydroxy-4-methyl-2-oxoglutarate aldolase
MMPANDALHHLLAPFPAATVDEAQGRVGALPAAIKPIDPRSRICAPAYCVRTTPGNNLMLHRAIYEAPAGSVLVADVGGPSGYEFGYWGDIMTMAALERGLAGLVIDGGARDAFEIQESGFAVFCRMLAIRGTLKASDGELGMRVTIGSVSIATGDIIVADRDGAVAVPAAQVEAVAGKARERMEKEAAVIERLRRKESTLDIFGFR